MVLIPSYRKKQVKRFALCLLCYREF